MHICLRSGQYQGLGCQSEQLMLRIPHGEVQKPYQQKTVENCSCILPTVRHGTPRHEHSYPDFDITL